MSSHLRAPPAFDGGAERVRLTGFAMWAKTGGVPIPSTEQSISPMERALLAYVRHVPISWGKYRLVNAAWRHVAGRDHKREAHLLFSGFRIPCDIGEFIQRQLYFFGTYYLERSMLDVWRSFARQSDVVFDVGANAGIYSLAALSANPRAKVHAFEPTPEIAERLREAGQCNNLASLIVVEAAVCDKAGQARLVQCDGGGGNGGMNFISQDPVKADDQFVAATSLDAYCQANGIKRIDLIKVDVQGLEPDVFRGGQGLLRGGKIGTVFVELNWGQPDEDSSANQLIALLETHGFLFSEICAEPNWRPAGDWLRKNSDIMASQGKAAGS